ncbi:MAG: LysR family transcriptional regulator [Myxococcota bacterium]
MTEQWDHLRHFLALSRASSLQRAGERLGVSHTTVLRRVRALESTMETKLFDVTPEGWGLTPAGAELLSHAELIEEQFSDISRALVGRDPQIRGTVVIAAPESIAMSILPGVLAALRERHPNIEIDLRVSRAHVDLSSREADIALRITRTPPEHLIGRRLFPVGLVYVASSDYVAAHGADFPSEVGNHRFIVIRGNPGPAQAQLSLSLHPTALLQVDCFVTAGQLCRAGVGITELPTTVLEHESYLVPMKGAPKRGASPLWLLMPRELRRLARVRTVADFLFDALRRPSS